MPAHIEIAKKELTHASVCRTELRRTNNLFDKFIRNRFAGDVVTSKRVEIFFFGKVVFVELRRHLNEVAIDIRARQRRIFRVGEQRMQAVTELVEESVDLAICQE